MNLLATALKQAKSTGLERPKVRYAGMIFTLAKPNSHNPGYIYIKDSNYQYIGKIHPDGRIFSAADVILTFDRLNNIKELLNNPQKALMEEGKLTGTCCCCGRTLTNPLSIDLGIGPICRGQWFPETTESDYAGLVITDEELKQLEQEAESEVLDTIILEDKPVSITLDKNTEQVATAIAAYLDLSSEQKMEFYAYVIAMGEK